MGKALEQMDFTALDKIIDEAHQNIGDYSLFSKVLSKVKFPYTKKLMHEMAGIDPFSEEYIEKMSDIHRALIHSDSRDQYSYTDEGVHDLDISYETKNRLPMG